MSQLCWKIFIERGACLCYLNRVACSIQKPDKCDYRREANFLSLEKSSNFSLEYIILNLAMESKDQEVSEPETDLLIRRTKKQKDEIATDHTTQVSFLETLLSKIDEPDINYVTQSLENINFLDEQENPQNYPNFIPITTNEKHRLYAPWKHALIFN